MRYYVQAFKYYLVELVISVILLLKGRNPLDGWKSFKEWQENL